jgi:hypothetical protein
MTPCRLCSAQTGTDTYHVTGSAPLAEHGDLADRWDALRLRQGPPVIDPTRSRGAPHELRQIGQMDAVAGRCEARGDHRRADLIRAMSRDDLARWLDEQMPLIVGEAESDAFWGGHTKETD